MLTRQNHVIAYRGITKYNLVNTALLISKLRKHISCPNQNQYIKFKKKIKKIVISFPFYLLGKEYKIKILNYDKGMHPASLKKALYISRTNFLISNTKFRRNLLSDLSV